MHQISVVRLLQILCLAFLPTRAGNAVCTDEWRRVRASGIDMKSAQPQSRKMENKGVEGQ